MDVKTNDTRKNEMAQKLEKFHYTAFAVIVLIVIALIISVICNIVTGIENSKLSDELEAIASGTESSTESPSDSNVLTTDSPATKFPATIVVPVIMDDTTIVTESITEPATNPITEPVTEPITEALVHKTVEEILREKYAYVLDCQRWDGQDFTIERMKYLYDKCEEYQISMEFVMSIYYTESTFRSQVKNKNSTATGYGQITAGTADFTYERLLKLGDYNEDNHVEIIRNDWKLSIDLTTKLIDWLYARHGNYTETAKHYYGSTKESANKAYAVKINNACLSLFDIELVNLTDTPIYN